MDGIKETGKGLFFGRLSKEMKNQGITIISDLELAHDISLQAVIQTPTNTKKYVIRLDGIWNNTEMDFNKENKKIIGSLSRANGIIYQSNFSKIMCDKYLGIPNKEYAIIGNGAPIDDAQKTNEKIVFVSSRWRPHKRLEDAIETFLLADISDSLLWVAGNLELCGIKESKLKEYRHNPRIFFLGVLNEKQMKTCLRKAMAFIHLCWLDYCPNGVVEALAAGLPVITNNVGGTCELVENSGGFVLPLDKDYDLMPCQLYSPPKIDRNQVAEALRFCFLNEIYVKNDHIDIRKIAAKYIRFFESLL